MVIWNFQYFFDPAAVAASLRCGVRLGYPDGHRELSV